MKSNLKKLFFLAALIAQSFMFSIQAQGPGPYSNVPRLSVGSGMTFMLDPNEGATIDQKEYAPDPNNTTSNKGLLFTRVTLSRHNQLYPMFLYTPTDSASGPNASYDMPEEKLRQDSIHIGLVVYNIKPVESQNLVVGLYVWDGVQWSPVSGINAGGNTGAYIANCGNVGVIGDYISPNAYGGPVSGDTVPLVPNENYIELLLQVTKSGTYEIKATAAYAGDESQDNGYSFTFTQKYDEPTTQLITLKGEGTPKWFTPEMLEGDLLTFTINEKPLKTIDGFICQTRVKVTDGTAQATVISCDDVEIAGNYQSPNSPEVENGPTVALNPDSSYISVTLNVTRKGKYVLEATPKYAGDTTQTNGYSFYIDGEFDELGLKTVIIPAEGAPQWFTPKGTGGDVVTVTLNGKPLGGTFDAACDPSTIVVVNTSLPSPEFNLGCQSSTVYGDYVLGEKLDTTQHYITIRLNNIPPESEGATYVVQTDTRAGISFIGTGLLTGAHQQVVTLYGHGTPKSIGDKYFTISANSIVNEGRTCRDTVTVTSGVYSTKKILVLGNSTHYGYNLSLAGTGSNKVLTSPNNFGTLETSKVQSEKVEFLNGSYGIPQSFDGDLSWTQNNRSMIQLCLSGADPYRRPDIVVLTHNVYIDAEEAGWLADYVDAGGVLVCFWEANFSALPLMNAIFDRTGMTEEELLIAGRIYGLPAATPENESDPILNGPFMDVRGLQWGEDASWATAISGLPEDEIVNYSGVLDMSGGLSGRSGGVTAFRHKTKNFIYFGDGGFNSSEPEGTGLSKSDIICPFWYDQTTGEPKAKPNYGYGSTQFSVYNSHIFCNIMAWALERAENNGFGTK